MQPSAQLLEQLNTTYSITFDSLAFLREGGCRSYLAADGTQRYFLKEVPPVFWDTIKQSLDILVYLAGKGLSVPPVLLGNGGLPYLEMKREEERQLYALFGYVEGREPEEGEELEEIGRLIGKLHAAMEGYPNKLTERGKPFFIERYLSILEKKNISESKLAQFREYGNALWERVKDLPRGYCHGDLHRGNLLRTDDGNHVVLDFDTSCTAYASFDVMTFCDHTNYFQYEPEGYARTMEALERFLQGYTRERAFTDEEYRAIPDWIAIRHYQLQATIIEVFGLDCVDEAFVEEQLEWLLSWREQCSRSR
ncbi:phosphotransferase [Gorillibacterium sp. CAU 1737]|uniref:phosphotransferase enzyme family protein n=1 Tax=Gorillibacterium sp. CAU 1737 TaxID=3140362 RepID=UPI0032606D27